MKETIALAVFLGFAAPTLFFAVTARIGRATTALFLVFSLLSGWGIANYDWIRGVKWEMPGIGDFRKEASGIKENALADLRKEIESGVSGAAGIRKKLEAQEKAIAALTEAVKKAEESMGVEREKVRELTDRAEQARDKVLAVYKDFSELSLLMTRIVYLQFEARDDSAGQRAEAATRRVMDGLDEVVGLIIPDPQERSKFISEIVDSLPPAQQQ